MLYLIPPGKRKNKFWLIRGTHEGHKIEQSTGKSLRQDAESVLNKLIREYEAGKTINENVTFAEAAARYLAQRPLDKKTEQGLKRIIERAGERLVSDFRLNDLLQLANQIFPVQSAATKNRYVITPMSAVLHYAAVNDWCQYRQFRKIKEPAPKPRYVTPETEAKLLNATTGKQYLFLLWLFRQGDRLSDVLRMTYEDCDLRLGIVNRFISKSNRHIVLPLDSEIMTILKAEQKSDTKTGFIFPWRNPTGIQNWLKPLRERLGVEFTCHMARHTLGKRLNDAGAGLKTIMQTLGHTSPQSSIRYQTTDIETIRRAKQKARDRAA